MKTTGGIGRRGGGRRMTGQREVSKQDRRHGYKGEANALEAILQDEMGEKKKKKERKGEDEAGDEEGRKWPSAIFPEPNNGSIAAAAGRRRPF